MTMPSYVSAHRPAWQRVRAGIAQVLAIPAVGPSLALLVAIVFFSFQTDKFLTGQNFSLIVQQVVVVGTLAVGQTLVILTAGIDLSNGMVMALGSVIMTSLAVEFGVPPLVAIIAGLAGHDGLRRPQRLVGCVCQASAVHRYVGHTQYRLCDHADLQNDDHLELAALDHFLGNTFDIGATAITYGSVLMLLIYLVVWYILRETAWGRHVYAVGDNAEADPPGRYLDHTSASQRIYRRWFIYGIAGLLLVARTRSAIRRQDRRRTWIASPPSCLAARVCLAGEAQSSGP